MGVNEVSTTLFMFMAFSLTCGNGQDQSNPIPGSISNEHRNLSPWGNGFCSGLCGPNNAQEIMTRTCLTGPNGSPGCAGPFEEIRQCTIACPFWGEWGYDACSVSCGGGTRFRFRQCLNVQGPNNCVGKSNELETCNTGPCSGDGVDPNYNVSPWVRAGECNGQCTRPPSKGTQSWSRTCITGDRESPGCVGPYEETRECTPSCNAEWGAWSEYTSCSATCNHGTKTRDRNCNRYFNDQQCNGDSEMTIDCNGGPCAGWNEWSTYDTCNAICNQLGSQTRRRSCPSGPPGSIRCPGSEIDQKICSKICGTWSEWGPFTACEGRCGHSMNHRTRICVNGEAGQPECYGKERDERTCYTGRNC